MTFVGGMLNKLKAQASSPVQNFAEYFQPPLCVQGILQGSMAKRLEGLQDHPRLRLSPPSGQLPASGDPPVERWPTRGALRGLAHPCGALARKRGIARLGATPLWNAGLTEEHRWAWHAPPLSAGMPEGHRQACRDPPVESWQARRTLGQPAYSP